MTGVAAAESALGEQGGQEASAEHLLGAAAASAADKGAGKGAAYHVVGPVEVEALHLRAKLLVRMCRWDLKPSEP